MAAQMAFLHVMAITLAGVFAQCADLQFQLHADVFKHLRDELRQRAWALVAQDLRHAAAGDDRGFMGGAMILVMVFAAHRVDALWPDGVAGLLQRADDGVAAGRETGIREVMLQHLADAELPQRAMRFVAAIGAIVTAATTPAEYQGMDARAGEGELGQAAATAQFDVIGMGADCQDVVGHDHVLAGIQGKCGRRAERTAAGADYRNGQVKKGLGTLRKRVDARPRPCRATTRRDKASAARSG